MPSGFKKVAAENRTAKMLAINETKWGWYKRPKKREGARKNKPGVVALREIRFYQISRVLLNLAMASKCPICLTASGRILFGRIIR